MTRPDWTFETRVSFRTGRKGRKRLRVGGAPVPVPVEPGHVPRVARLLALADRFRGLVASGDVRDYADLARLAGVTRARATQIMNLLLLAPDIQEAVLALPRVEGGRDPITERSLRPIVATPDWSAQRALWRALVGEESQRVDLDVSGGPRPHVSRRVAKGAAPEREVEMRPTIDSDAGPDPVGDAPAKPPCRLVGEDGNVFNVIRRVKRALKDAGQADRAREFVQKAFAARSYDEVLGLCYEYVDVR